MVREIYSFFKNRLKNITPIQAFILLVIIFATFFAVKFYGRSPQERIIKVQVVGRDWTQSFSGFEGFRAPFWLAEKIQVGDTEISPDAGVIAEVTKVEKYERETHDFEIFLTVKIKGELNTRTGDFKFKEKVIRVGEPITLNPGGVNVMGQIIDDNVTLKDLEKKEYLVTVRARNAEPWIISKVRRGDKIYDAPSGVVIAEVESVRTEPPSNTFFSGITNSGTTFVERSTRTQDLILVLRMKVEERDGLLYFAGFQRVKTGNIINLFFPEVNIFRVEIQNVQGLEF